MVITKMNMRNIILFVLSLFCISANGQNHQVDNFKTNLNSYETLCKLILEEIDCIQKHNEELNMKAEPKTQVMNLVNDIANAIKKNEEKNKRLYKDLVALKDSLSSSKTKSTVNPANDGRETPNKNPMRNVRETTNLENYLSLYTLAEIYEHRNEVEKEMSGYNSPKKMAYTYVIKLFEVQYQIYNRNAIKDLLARISGVQSDVLDKHKSELEEEIIRVNDYRYATKELQRLFGVIDNPPVFGSDATSSKWEDESFVDTNQLRKYLEDNEETENVYRFHYTKEQFEKYLYGNADERKRIKTQIEKALEN